MIYRSGGTISTLGRSVLHEFFRITKFCNFHRVKRENIGYLPDLPGSADPDDILDIYHICTY